ncbi:MAG: 16S rRNA (guanine(966)-N(2))-methyltransferase RsmD [Clostridium sp.]|nr:16S rRNA (guanine(966)-N(2))-methyltransferase RsmD [Clostridium sp.]MCM1444675.1 16S rRNA (guanine(966)-N(2))-methyltransferase RsmD [Candidatus Amulumruptor caecigallinarius]
MRIISGKYKGKILKGFNIEGTRPTMDRVKESIFATIQIYIKNSTCLDLFAGSGSFGIEALSNGARYAYFVDNSAQIQKVLKENLKGIDNYTLIQDDYKGALNKFKNEEIKFDIIFLDPPYKLNLLNESINLIEKFNLLKENGIIICEYEFDTVNTSLNVFKTKKYGNKKVIILKK